MQVGVCVKPRSGIRRLATASRVALWLVGAGLCLYLAGLALHLAAAIPFPYPTHYEDGPVLNAALTLARGGTLYPDNSSPPYVSSIYTPLHYLPFALLVALVGPNLAAARLLCLFNTALLALVLYRWVSWRTSRPAAALLSVAVLFTFLPVANWAAAARADTLAVAFSMAGGYLVDRYWHRRGLWLAIPLLVLAFFTKQTQVAAAAAAGLYLLAVAPRRALGFGALYLAALGIPFLLLDLLTGHGLYRHVVEYNSVQPHWWWRGKQLFKTYVLSYAGYLAIALGGAPALLRHGRIPFPAVYLATSLLSTATVISDGADFNHYIETATVTSLLVGVSLGRVLPSRFPTLKLAVSAVLALQVATRVPSVLPGVYAPWAYSPDAAGRGTGISEAPLWLGTPTRAARETGDELIAEIRSARGPVLTEMSAFATLAGQPAELDDPYIFTALSRANKWQQYPILERLRSGQFSLIPLLVDIRPPGFRHTRLTDEMVEAIRSSYRLEKTLAYPMLEGPRVYIYRPAAGGEPPVVGTRRE